MDLFLVLVFSAWGSVFWWRGLEFSFRLNAPTDRNKYFLSGEESKAGCDGLGKVWNQLWRSGYLPEGRRPVGVRNARGRK